MLLHAPPLLSETLPARAHFCYTDGMIPALRASFNALFTPAKYDRFLRTLAERAGMEVPFRVCETPCFFPAALLTEMADAGHDLIRQTTENPVYLAAARAAIPAGCVVPNETPLPLFVQADFGIDEAGRPQLVEIQGFPSLYAFQPLLAETYRDVYEIPGTSHFLPGITEAQFDALMRQALLNGHAPENVVLLEITPEKQKTRPDFLVTEARYGVRALCVSDIIARGDNLFRKNERGQEVPIHRIYNRVIFDELLRSPVTPGLDFARPYNVEWAGHPNWYFLLSKFSLPYFSHPTAPEARFLSDLPALPEDPENWVLKPLYSFAGKGVVVGPAPEDFAAALPDAPNYLVQRRVHFAPTIETPEGPTKAEIRIMYIHDGQNFVALTALVRMGRGKMLGVDHNRAQSWVGASAALCV